MAKKEDVLMALEMFHTNRPTHAFEAIHASEMGLFAVLRYLNDAKTRVDGTVTSKELSDALCVSSARMSVLLKKLEQKGFISKTTSPTDARAVVIALTVQGEVFAEQMHQRMYHTAAHVVDEFGIDELQRLMESVQKIKTILHQERPMQWEEDNV